MTEQTPDPHKPRPSLEVMTSFAGALPPGTFKPGDMTRIRNEWKEHRTTDQTIKESDCPTGTVELHLSIEVPLEAIVQHWTRDEAAALLAGDPVARDELVSSAASRSDLWSGFDVIERDIVVEGRRL